MATKTGPISKTAQQAAKNAAKLYRENVHDPRYLKNLTGEGGKATDEKVNVPQQKIAQAVTLAELLKKRGM